MKQIIIKDKDDNFVLEIKEIESTFFCKIAKDHPTIKVEVYKDDGNVNHFELKGQL